MGVVVSVPAEERVCAAEGVDPRKHFSGKLFPRVDPELHEAAAIAAAAHGLSLNPWAAEAIRQAARAC